MGVWYGMGWYGIVWYGRVWYGRVWYLMVWNMIWYGMVWYGMVWYGMVWYGMEPIRKDYREEMDRVTRDSELLKGLKEMSEANKQGLESMTAAIINGTKDKSSKLVKSAKVPSWSKGMKFDVYAKSLILS